MTYCLSLYCREGLVFLSDSRSNAGMDNINVHPKMHVYEAPGDRVLVLQSSGNLSITHSVLALIEEDLAQARCSNVEGGKEEKSNLLNRPSLFETARYVGLKIREVDARERAALEKDDFRFNVHFLVGGQIKGLPPQIYYVYPQGNVIHASEDSPFLQIGESKYGKPILDRGFKFTSSLPEAIRYGVLSMDSTMKSNVSVGPPIDILCYERDSLCVRRRVRLSENDPYLQEIRHRWGQGLNALVNTMPELQFAQVAPVSDPQPVSG
jgi:putative proteasome-type protease